jgi:site-specific recombinase XerD
MQNHGFSHETWLSELKAHLEKQRYARGPVQRYVDVAGHFLAYLEQQHIEPNTAQPADVERYLQRVLRMYHRRHGHLPDYKAWRSSHTGGVHMLLRLVQGQWPPVPEAVTSAEILQRNICEQYVEYMTGVRGLVPVSVLGRCDEARHFFNWMGGGPTGKELAALTVSDIDAYMKDRAGSLRRPTLRNIACNMRSFLRWLHTAGHVARDLSTAVIAPSLYAFEGIPSSLSAQDIEKILSVTRQDRTRKGIRDYAILMLLSRYGIRAGEVTSLRLDDINWRKDTIRIRHTKTGVFTHLPLLTEVGGAILDYLQKSRPEVCFREIFIRNRAPYRPFKRGGSLYTPIRRRIEAAGVVTAGKRGPHSFRHARAVSLLRGGVPLKEIGDVLGHRASNSTLVYLKLATEDLRAVALEIPVEVKP